MLCCRCHLIDSHITTQEEATSNLRGPSDNIITNHLPAAINPDEIQTAHTNISKLREEFYTRYGGKEIATTMLKKGVRTFENKNTKDANSISIQATANRFLSAKLYVMNIPYHWNHLYNNNNHDSKRNKQNL